MEIDQEIAASIAKYEQNDDDKNLLMLIRKVISEKGTSWDLGLRNENKDMLAMLLFEYAKGIEKITGKKVSPKYTIKKISDSLGILRFGEFKKGLDDEVTYGMTEDENGQRPLKVTEEEYSYRCRTNKKGGHKFGAHAPIYKDKDGYNKVALVLFEEGQTLPDGTVLSGIDFKSLADIRHTFFHELTHVMEKSVVSKKDLSSDDIVFSHGEQGSLFINYMETADKNGLDYYIESMNQALKADEVTFSGISTIEINPKKSSNRIMRNQISEGATELISNLVMEANGFEAKDKFRYYVQQQIVNRAFNTRGMEESLTDYLTSSNKLISYLESIKVGEKDFLHYADEFVNETRMIGPSIDMNLDETADRGKLEKAYNMLWRDDLTEEQRTLTKYFISQEISEHYRENPDPRKRMPQERILKSMNMADKFGMAFNELFPEKINTLETKDKTSDGKQENLEDDNIR